MRGHGKGREPAPIVREPFTAAGRDASWYSRPDVRSVKALHIATVDWTSACNPGPEFQRCMPLAECSAWPAEQVYDDMRCRRPGCRVWWAKVPAKPRSSG